MGAWWRISEVFWEKINSIKTTIKFTANWPYSLVIYLDVKFIVKNGKIITDLYVKPTDTHQYLPLFIMPPILLQKSIPYSQILHLNTFCSNKAFFDQRCNELEHWLHEQRHSERVVRQGILEAQIIPRNELIEQECYHTEENKLMFNITHYPAFQNTKKKFRRITDSTSARQRASENVS